PGAPDAPAAGVPGTSDGHYGGTRGPPGSGCDSPQATPHPEVLLTSTNRPSECHQRPGRVHLGGVGVGVLKRYRYRAYPTGGQGVALARTFGCVRVVFNDVIAARRAQHAQG